MLFPNPQAPAPWGKRLPVYTRPYDGKVTFTPGEGFREVGTIETASFTDNFNPSSGLGPEWTVGQIAAFKAGVSHNLRSAERERLILGYRRDPLNTAWPVPIGDLDIMCHCPEYAVHGYDCEATPIHNGTPGRPGLYDFALPLDSFAYTNWVHLIADDPYKPCFGGPINGPKHWCEHLKMVVDATCGGG